MSWVRCCTVAPKSLKRHLTSKLSKHVSTQIVRETEQYVLIAYEGRTLPECHPKKTLTLGIDDRSGDYCTIGNMTLAKRFHLNVSIALVMGLTVMLSRQDAIPTQAKKLLKKLMENVYAEIDDNTKNNRLNIRFECSPEDGKGIIPLLDAFANMAGKAAIPYRVASFRGSFPYKASDLSNEGLDTKPTASVWVIWQEEDAEVELILVARLKPYWIELASSAWRGEKEFRSFSSRESWYGNRHDLLGVQPQRAAAKTKPKALGGSSMLKSLL